MEYELQTIRINTSSGSPVIEVWNGLDWYSVATTASLGATYPALRPTPPDHTVVVAYIDTSTVPPVLKGWNGTGWVALGGTTTPSLTNHLLTESGGALLTESGSYLLVA